MSNPISVAEVDDLSKKVQYIQGTMNNLFADLQVVLTKLLKQALKAEEEVI